jgi:hypothetical protein
MYARVVRTQSGTPPGGGNAGEFIRENVVPRAREVPGLKKGYWFIDTENRRGLNVSIYESREAIDAAADGIRQLQERASQTTGVQFSEAEVYELVAET